MPSPDFMKAVLESDQARMARGEVVAPPEIEEEPPSEDLPEEPEEGEPDQPAEEEHGEAAEGEEEVADEDAHDDEGESEEEPQAEHEDFYLEVGGARYRTREEAERGVEETRRAFLDRSQRAAEAEREAAELRQRLAYMEGRDSTRGSEEEGDFEAWADARIEANAEQGMIEAIQASRDADDQAYAYAYTDRWAETDPYQAAIWRNRLETAIFQTQAQPAPEESGATSEVQQVINDTWTSLANEYPDLQDDQTIQGIADTIRSDPELRQAALTGDPTTVRLAFTAARKVVRSQRNAPKRVRTSDAERMAREKRAATVSSGDGAPTRRSSSPDLSAEEESLLAGADRLGLKRREQ